MAKMRSTWSRTQAAKGARTVPSDFHGLQHAIYGWLRLLQIHSRLPQKKPELAAHDRRYDRPRGAGIHEEGVGRWIHEMDEIVIKPVSTEGKKYAH